jgi:hypothetical protein
LPHSWQLGKREWFGKAKPGFLPRGGSPEEDLRIGREVKDGDALAVPDAPGRRDAVPRTGQVHVHQDPIRVSLLREPHRLLARQGASTDLIPETVKLASEVERRDHLVFHQENLPAVHTALVVLRLQGGKSEHSQEREPSCCQAGRRQAPHSGRVRHFGRHSFRAGASYLYSGSLASSGTWKMARRLLLWCG